MGSFEEDNGALVAKSVLFLFLGWSWLLLRLSKSRCAAQFGSTFRFMLNFDLCAAQTLTFSQHRLQKQKYEIKMMKDEINLLGFQRCVSICCWCSPLFHFFERFPGRLIPGRPLRNKRFYSPCECFVLFGNPNAPSLPHCSNPIWENRSAAVADVADRQCLPPQQYAGVQSRPRCPCPRRCQVY